MKFGIRRAVTLLVALLAAPSIVWGQAWPTKPVKIVAPFAAGRLTATRSS
jgi:tripartite-type tricarboxylate transporter receptor subunit TctC